MVVSQPGSLQAAPKERAAAREVQPDMESMMHFGWVWVAIAGILLVGAAAAVTYLLRRRCFAVAEKPM